MKNNTIIIYAMLCMVIIGCTKYPDEWGYSVKFGETRVEMKNLSPTGYDLAISTEIQEINGDIDSFSFFINGSEYPAQVTTSGGKRMMSTFLADCDFGQNYLIHASIGNSESVTDAKSVTFKTMQNDYKPVLGNPQMELIDNQHLKVSVNYDKSDYLLPTSVQIAVGNVEQSAKLDSGIASAIIDLKEINNIGNVLNVIIWAENDYGNSTATLNFAELVHQYSPKLTDVKLHLENGSILKLTAKYDNNKFAITKPILKAVFFGEEVAVTDNNGIVSAQRDIYDLAYGTYNGVSLNIKNLFGDISEFISYSVKVSQSTANVEVNGGSFSLKIDNTTWASSNLSYDGLLNDAKSLVRNNYGYYAKNTMNSPWQYTARAGQLGWYDFYPPTVTFYQGESEYDAAANILGEQWKTPSSVDFTQLIQNTSKQWDGSGMLFVPIKDGKSFYSSSNVLIDENSMNGIYLTACGYYRRYQYTEYNVYWHQESLKFDQEIYDYGTAGYYLCSNALDNDEGYVRPYMLYFDKNGCEIKNMTIWDGGQIRPIKAN